MIASKVSDSASRFKSWWLLQPKPKQRLLKATAAGLVLWLVGKLVLIAALSAANSYAPVPLARYYDRSAVVLAGDGRPLYVGFAADGLKRTHATVKNVSDTYIKALIDFEDRRFFSHDGVDKLALVRASLQMIKNRQVISGGSTLTMQTVRMLEPRPRTLRSKIVEIFRAWQLETRYSKQQILSFYMTLAPMGGNIEGVRTASLLYYNKEAKELSLAEAALLVALPQSPSDLAPRNHPDRARRARDKVARRIQKTFGASDSELRAVRLSPVIYRQSDTNKAPLLATRLARRGDTVTTSIQPQLQKSVQALLATRLGSVDSDATLAAMVMDARTGDVLAYVGNAAYGDFNRAGFMDMLQAVRSPGSTLKPFIYGLAMDDHLIALETKVQDEHSNFGTYSPTNFDENFSGETTIKRALQQSLNIPVVKVLNRLGSRRFASMMEDVGLPLAFPAGTRPTLPLALGGAGISAEDLVSLYSALAVDGTITQPVFGRYDSQAPTNDSTKRPALLSEGTRAQLQRTLIDTTSPYPTIPARFALDQRTVAFKTGTSYGYRDAWAMGTKGPYVIGVWVGKANAQPHPGHYGISAAAPALMDIAALISLDPDAQAIAAVGQTAFIPEWADLPRYQKNFDRVAPIDKSKALTYHAAAPVIRFPYDCSIMAYRAGQAISLEMMHGTRPFKWYVNGKPLAVSPLKRSLQWQADGPGFYNLVVIDSLGQKDAISVRLKDLALTSVVP